MVPLREKREFMSGERLVSDEQMAQIFGDIENFPAINKALLARLQEEHSKPDDERLIGQVFLKTFDFFIVYTQYLCKHVCTILTKNPYTWRESLTHSFVLLLVNIYRPNAWRMSRSFARNRSLRHSCWYGAITTR